MQDEEKQDGKRRISNGLWAIILMGIAIAFYVGTMLQFGSSH